MMSVSLILKQVFIAVSPQFAAFASGGAVTYPSILLQQLNSNNSSIRLDIHTSSWLGSIHGLTGILAILVPTIMQWKGRRLAFLISSFISILGWLLAYTATNVTALLIGESCHGLGTNSLMAVTMLTLSELAIPKFRNVSMIAIFIAQTLGMTAAGILAQYLHWKTISIVMGTPMVIAFLCALTWPESPFWLAYKGEYDKCEEAFVWLRGSNEASMKELHELIAAQKENNNNDKTQQRFTLKHVWGTVKRKDFYMPSLFMLLLLNLMYWGGSLVFMIYEMELIYKTTENQELAAICYMIINASMFVGGITTNVLIRYFNNKSVLLFSALGTAVSLFIMTVITSLQNTGILSTTSTLFSYFSIGYMFLNSLGANSLVFSMSAELMPVKHRGIGGSLIVIFTCVLHASSLKLAPYMFLYIGLPGTFLIYFVNVTLCGLLIWKYVPETKGKTLQEIEDYYCNLRFQRRSDLVTQPILCLTVQ